MLRALHKIVSSSKRKFLKFYLLVFSSNKPDELAEVNCNLVHLIFL